jgi:hypothetical protein
MASISMGGILIDMLIQHDGQKSLTLDFSAEVLMYMSAIMLSVGFLWLDGVEKGSTTQLLE